MSGRRARTIRQAVAFSTVATQAGQYARHPQTHVIRCVGLRAVYKAAKKAWKTRRHH